MRFDPIDTFDPTRQASGLVVRPRRWPSLLVGLVALGIGVALVALAPDLFFRLAIGGFLVLFGLIFLAMFRRLGGTRAWLLAVDAQGLSVMLRSPLRAPADGREETVVTLPWREIAWVRPAREQRAQRTKNGTTYEGFRYLDVAVRDVDVAALARKVDEASETPSSWKNSHQQTSLVDGDVLRLHYSGPSVVNGPSLKTVLRALEGHTTVREEVRID